MGKDGVVVDANVIKLFMGEEINDSGEIYDLIHLLLECCGLAVNEMIEHEWKSVTGNSFFEYWFTEMLKLNKIKFVDDTVILTSAEKRVIHNTYGLPKRNSRDIEYIKCAINTDIKYILTQDIDFFDPKKKKSSHKDKYRVKNKRAGVFCKYLKKQFSITVGLPEHCCIDLSDAGIIK